MLPVPKVPTAKLTNPDLVEQIEKTGVVLYHREENAFVAEDSTLAST